MTAESFIGGASGTGSTVFVSLVNGLPVQIVGSGGGSGSVIITGSPGTETEGTITAGGTAQNLFSGATPTNGFSISNPDPTNDLWISESTTAVAQSGTRISSNGGYYASEPGYKPSHAVSIVGAVTSQKFTARSW